MAEDKLRKMIQEELPEIILKTAFEGIKEYIECGDWYYAEDVMESIADEIDNVVKEEVKELCQLPEFKAKIRQVAEKNMHEIITSRL